MGLRSELLADLVCDVLGPRNGPYEIMETSPLTEYLTGVLQPVDVQALDIDSQAEGLCGEEGAGDEDMGSAGIAPVTFTPAMDPRKRPASMGLSFRVRTSTGKPTLAACVTWARYTSLDDSGKGGGDEAGAGTKKRPEWQREPRAWILDPLQDGELQPGKNGKLIGPSSAASEVTLHVEYVADSHESGVFHVILSLVNQIIPKNKSLLGVEDCVFQPQIRVVCLDDTKLEASGWSLQTQDEEESQLQFLYRDRPALARGHLVSAVWKEVDPERDGSQQVEQERPDRPPFRWVDGDLLDTNDRARFTAPDVRTEFVPIYSLHAPDWQWDDAQYGQQPELDPSRLADLAADGKQLRQALQPLLDGYQNWIQDQRRQSGGLSGNDRKVAADLIRRCEETRDRIKAGLILLQQDQEVRLAFAFANQAMATQAQWQRRPLRWRPFQLAFILLNLPSVVNPNAPDRNVCDLLWVPTGGGKTEAYLALAAFTIAYRRLRALRRQRGDRTGAGVSVISRYTLRLLTVQQFRRALAMITACEMLRVKGLRQGGPVGWRPNQWPDKGDFLWGSTPFCIGLWVGGGVTPNRLESIYVRNKEVKEMTVGALEILGGQKGEGEPAQVLRCPACGAWLAIPEEGLPPGQQLHLVIRTPAVNDVPSFIQNVLQNHASSSFQVRLLALSQQSLQPGYCILSLEVNAGQQPVRAYVLDTWWKNGPGKSLELQAFRPSRPGYFPVKIPKTRKQAQLKDVDFEIWCPNPECRLGEEWWCAGVPADISGLQRTGRKGGKSQLGNSPGRQVLSHPNVSGRSITIPDGQVFRTVTEPWRAGNAGNHPGYCFLAGRVPIPALTVDEQIYRHPPSVVVATVDKFARLPFEPDAAALFGNVRYYEVPRGYCRQPKSHSRCKPVDPLDPPDLILQDELHLIEGPLGSLVGLYETAIDYLCEIDGRRVKYIAATATVRGAKTHVESLFDRELRIFPPPGLRIGDRFFMRALAEPHPLDERKAGQLYVGICAPGRGPLTPVSRIWACLLQQVFQRAKTHHNDVDYYWTLVGYFNAIRELAGALALYRQDIPQRISDAFTNAKPRRLDEPLELSSRISSTDLPALLERLSCSYPRASDAVLATSMFGTGVDISRLSLMVVHGQPKTTASYIQATGRVGRERGALVVTFLRASRPRDLSHYEFFCGYHRQLHRHVEPLTVMPFSPGALDVGTGPVMVAILRNRRDPCDQWYLNDTAGQMAGKRQLVNELPQILENRAQCQPQARRPAQRTVLDLAHSGLDRWEQTSRLHCDLEFVEYAIVNPPRKPVVLGDPQHQQRGLPVVFENAPQSLREVEQTLDFELI